MTVERRLQKRILEWYGKSGRDFPWRQTRSPYRILVAEIMLQQTQASRVVDKWKEFLGYYPGVRSLAQAPLGDVIRRWGGLGYNSRALRLHQCARIIVEKYHGRFPVSLTELLGLPGIGPYTGSALSCFAYGARVPVVDVNIRRVLTRLFSRVKRTGEIIPEDRAWNIAGRLLPGKNFYEWNQALMDLGATVCTARVPKCETCPVSRQCRSAHAIDSGRRSTTFPKREPMCGPIPRRLLRGAIISYLRTVDRNSGVPECSIADHLLTTSAGVTRRDIHETILRLISDGLLVVRTSNRHRVSISFP